METMEREVDFLRKEIVKLQKTDEKLEAYLSAVKERATFMQIELLITEVALVVLAVLHILGR